MNLHPYYDVVRDANGNAVAGATVNIHLTRDGSLAAVYDKAGNPITQPLVTDPSGAIVNGSAGEAGIGFWAPAGRYRVEVSSGAEVAALPEIQLGPQITNLDQSTDLNDIVQPGAYDVFIPANSPDGATSSTWWYVEVVRHSQSTDNVLQVATRLDSGTEERHFRLRKAAVWGPWIRLLDGANPAATRALIELDNVPNVDATVAANIAIADAGNNFAASNIEDALAEEADARQAFETTKGQAGGLAPLDEYAKVPTSYLPALSLTDVTVMGSEAEQLALTAQEGDVAVRSDISTSYIHNGGTAGTMADWTELQTPPDAVLSVFGRTGAVSAQSGDYIAAQIPIADAGGIFTATEVESALAELAAAGVAHQTDPDPHSQYATDTDLAAHTGDLANPHQVTATQVGLGNVQDVDTTLAANVGISDAGGNFAATDVEGALAEEADARQAHEAAADPHPQYATDNDLAAHTGDFANPHQVTATQVGLGNVQNVDTTVAANIAIADAGGNFTATDVESALAEEAGARQAFEATKGQGNGLAPLDASAKIPTSYLPALSISEVSVVASEAEQLALIAQEGDVAVRSDISTSYIHNGGTAGTMADWTELQTAPDTVLSVFGRTGAVSAQSGDYIASQVPITDAGGVFSATDVENALTELAAAGIAHQTDANPHPQYATDTDLAEHAGDLANPHQVTAAQVGLSNVQNVDTTFAANVSISDPAGNFTATDVEGALQEMTGLIAGANGQYFTEGRDASYAQPVHSWEATGAESDISVALIPKGAGSLSAAVPDYYPTGGAPRGQHAVDWQQTRSSYAQVASGDNSTIVGGQNCSAPGAGSVAGGSACYASGTDAVAVGSYSQAQGNYSTALGRLNLVYDDASFGAGDSNQVYGRYCTIPGGSRGTTRGVSGTMAFSSGSFSVIYGLAQTALRMVRSETQDGSTWIATTEGNQTPSATNVAVIPDNHSYLTTVKVVATHMGTGDTKAWKIEGLAKRDTGEATTTLVGTPIKQVIAQDSGAAAWDCNLVANTTRGAAELEVTGETGKIVYWSAKFETVEVGS